MQTRVPHINLELAAGCDQACAHCYNVWNADKRDPQGGYDVRGQMQTVPLMRMLEKLVRQSECETIIVSGGEPLLRKDALQIIEHISSLGPNVQLITNGSHLAPDVARRLAAAGVRSVQLTLLSRDRVKHNRLKGADSFDDTIGAAIRLNEHGVEVQACFVAMAENWMDFEGVLELCLPLDIHALSYNRMSATGRAVHHMQRLMPTVDQVRANLDTGDRLGRTWDIRIATAMPIPPCLIPLERYSWIEFGFCGTGTDDPSIVVDAKGNVRSCSLSSTVLGNLIHQDWAEIMANPYPAAFRRNVPLMCRGCRFEQTCGGGCKESGFAAFGDHTIPEPFLSFAGRGPFLKVISNGSA